MCPPSDTDPARQSAADTVPVEGGEDLLALLTQLALGSDVPGRASPV